MSINIGPSAKGGPLPAIAVMGVGGGGGNAIRSMVEGALTGVQYLAANTDVQALGEAEAERKIVLGTELTRGYGAGTDPTIGRRAAEESLEDIREALAGLDMLFLTGGMGGGTGTGASPVIARIARELGILTVGVVTTPFDFEGEARMEAAKRGVRDTLEQVDTLLLIANQNIFRLENGVPNLFTAFETVNTILRDAIRGVIDLVTRPGMINTDFADLEMALRDGGLGVIGEGVATGTDRARQAAIQAATNPLLDGVTLEGAGRLLINVTGGRDLGPEDFDEAVNYLRGLARDNVKMKVGASFDPQLEGSVRVYIAASGVDQDRTGDSVVALRSSEAPGDRTGVREIRVNESSESAGAGRSPSPNEGPKDGSQASITPVRRSADADGPAASGRGRSESAILPKEEADDDWNDGIGTDVGSQSTARTVAVSPTLSGGLQDQPLRSEAQRGPRFRPGHRRSTSSIAAERLRNAGPTARPAERKPASDSAPAAKPAAPKASAQPERPPREAPAKASGRAQPAERGGRSGAATGQRRDLGVRAGVASSQRDVAQRERPAPSSENGGGTRGVASRSPGLLARLLSIKE